MTVEFESLITKHSNTIRNIARSFCNSDDHEDLIQDILVQLWRSFSRFRGDSTFETWLYRIAINTAINYQRAVIKTRKGKENSESAQNITTSLDGLSHEQILQAFINQLNQVDRAVLMMYVDGFSSNEMESVLGIKANAIKVRVSRLKAKFNEQFIN